MTVIIGVDPHKASHTAVAIGGDERELGSVKVRATRRQLPQLLSWAESFEKRKWAIESAGGLGYLLSQQLVAAGEDVIDVPATLASRVRVLGTGRSDKNDPNDARSVAIAALRAPALRSVEVANHAEVLRLLANATSTLGVTEPGSCADCTRHWLTSRRAESPRNSTLPTPSSSSLASNRPAPSNRPVTTLRSSSSTMSVVSTPNSRRRTSGSATRCARRTRHSLSCSVSARSSLVP